MLLISFLICGILTGAVVARTQRWHGDEPMSRFTNVLEDNCPMETRLVKFQDQVLVRSNIGSSYRTNVSCTMTIRAADDQLDLIAVILSSETAGRNDFMEIGAESGALRPLRYDGPDRSEGDPKDEWITFSNATVIIKWHVPAKQESRTTGKGFAVMVTAFVRSCPPEERCFRCGSGGYLVHEWARCNGGNNCGDWSDEQNC